MRQPSEALFDLINSMTRGEKLYFRKFVNSITSEGKTNYIRLYEAVESSKKYDEGRIKKNLFAKSPSMNFAYEKLNLTNIICRALISYNSGNSSDNKVSELLSTAMILEKKLLYQNALQRLRQAEKIAEKYELFPGLLRIIEALRRITKKSGANTKGALHQLNKKEQLTFAKLRNVSKLSSMTDRVYFAGLFTSPEVEDTETHIKELIASPVVQSINKALSYTATCEYYKFRKACEFLRNNPRKEVDLGEQQIKYMEQFPHFIQDDPFYFIQTQVLLLNSMGAYRPHDETKKQFDKIAAMLHGRKFDIAYESRRRFAYLSLTALANNLVETTSFNQISNVVALVHEAISEYGLEHEKRFQYPIFINMAWVYFILREYNESLKWINKVVLDKEQDAFKGEMVGMARVLNWLIHYELLNFEVMEYSITSTLRFLKNRRGYIGIETEIGKHLKKLASAFAKNDQLASLYLKMKKELDSIDLSKETHTAVARGMANRWLESKITGKTLLAIVNSENR